MSKTNDLLSDIAETLAAINDKIDGVAPAAAPAQQAAPAPAPAPQAPRTNGDVVRAALIAKINDYQSGRLAVGSVERAADIIVETILIATGAGRRTAEQFLNQRAL